jgi:hypothetical protein
LLADDVDGLIAATRRLVDDPQLRCQMGENGVARVRELSWERHARTTLEELHAARDRAPAPAQATAAGPMRRAVTAALVTANVAALIAAALVSTAVIAGLIGAELLVAVAVGFMVIRRPTSATPRTVPETPA